MNRLPPLYSLQVFAVVAREGNMSRAAGRLFLTQSAVSRQIALLEDYLGKPVFARQARGVALTAVGQALLPTVEGAFDAIAKVIAELGPQSTELRIHLPPTLAMRWFLPRLAGYQRLQAGVDVRVTTGHGVGVQLEQQNLDAAVVFGKEGSEFANATPLFAERLTPVCAPAMAQRLRQPADLANETLIHLSADHADWRAWLAAAGVSHPDLAAGPSFEVIDMAVNLASQGRGVAIADPVMIADDLLKGSLCAPFAAVTVAFGHRYWFSCPHGRQAEPALLAMRDWLEAEIAATLAALATIGLGEQAP